ncbi:BQ2448_322 [Microbotryum intermedium]|uniref:BQ2448_322 protein n=1 Tax=Microbotryum intermedium TaxID=269621 RepID=A0A238F7Z0_9BASI|nr:BQ2448_322 [Microbotryum intermedium]
MATLILVALTLHQHTAQAALTLRGPVNLVQCEYAAFNWSGGIVPYSFNAGPVTGSSVEQNATDWQGVNWLVDWPAGTPINFRVATALRIDPYPDQTYAYAGTKIVQPSATGDASCIPESHTHEPVLPNQMFITSPFYPTYKVCDPVNVTWTGGVGPFTIMVIPVDWEQYAQTFTTPDRLFTWTPTIHGRTSVYLTIAPSDFSVSKVVHSPTVFIDDSLNNGCVDPAFHNVSYIARPEKTHPRTSDGPIQQHRLTPGITIGNRIVIGLGTGLILLVFYINRIMTHRVEKRMAYERLWYQGQQLKVAEAASALSGFSAGTSPIERMKARTLQNPSWGAMYYDQPADSMGAPIQAVR